MKTIFLKHESLLLLVTFLHSVAANYSFVGEYFDSCWNLWRYTIFWKYERKSSSTELKFREFFHLVEKLIKSCGGLLWNVGQTKADLIKSSQRWFHIIWGMKRILKLPLKGFSCLSWIPTFFTWIKLDSMNLEVLNQGYWFKYPITFKTKSTNDWLRMLKPFMKIFVFTCWGLATDFIIRS